MTTQLPLLNDFLDWETLHHKVLVQMYMIKEQTQSYRDFAHNWYMRNYLGKESLRQSREALQMREQLNISYDWPDLDH